VASVSEPYTAQGIPRSLTPFLQEYDLERLDPDEARHTLIERTLRYGSRAELRWLFRRYGEEAIAEWVQRWGRLGLPSEQLVFWRLVLDLQENS